MHGADPTTTSRRRVERFERAGSTNDIVRAWLAAGEPEVCVAVAGEQTAGRGRLGRTWSAPPGAALLVSLGFRPTWLAPGHAWRLAATVAMAMADAAEDIAGLPVGSIRCKWPNDLVIETAGPNALLMGVVEAEDAAARLAAPIELRKLAGILGESDGLGTDDPRVVVGIGINADWSAGQFPPELAATMTSLRVASADRPIDRDALLDEFLERLDGRIEALKAGYFDIATWTGRQATTGRMVVLDGHDRHLDQPHDRHLDQPHDRHLDQPVDQPLVAIGVDAATGALVVQQPATGGSPWLVHAGEVVRVRLVPGQV